MNHGICTPDGIKINGYYPGPITEIEPLESGDYKVYFNNGEYIVVPAKKSKDIKDVSETSDGNIELKYEDNCTNTIDLNNMMEKYREEKKEEMEKYIENMGRN